eukprot:1078551-Prymnesium_polylepis.1
MPAVSLFCKPSEPRRPVLDLTMPDLTIFAPPEDDSLESQPLTWFRELRTDVLPLFRCVPLLEVADVLLPPVDLMNPHYPSFLSSCCIFDGGLDAFHRERERRMRCFWAYVDAVLPLLSARQRILCIDLESDHAPCSGMAHEQKQRYAAADRRLVHASISMPVHKYRAGRDISLPAVLPSALGTAAQLNTTAAGRPLLFSFKGRCSHPVRERLLRLDNGTDQICLDCGEQRVAAQLRRPRRETIDASYAELHASSRFSLCPRGDAP